MAITITGSSGPQVITGTSDNPVYVTGTISIQAAGIALTVQLDVPAAIYNSGQIQGGALGEALYINADAGLAYVSNSSFGLIAGYRAMVIVQGPGNVVNYGQITGYGRGAINLDGSGSVTNGKGGQIVAQGTTGSAVYIGGGFGTVVNYGLITAANVAAIDLNLGGQVSNSSNATIIAQGTGPAVYATGGTATVTNSGSISANSGGGIDLKGGGAATNVSNATITSTSGWAIVAPAYATVMNAGMLSASGTRAAVALDAGGHVFNQAGGTITATGGAGVYLNAAGPVTAIVNNFARAVISGAHGVYVQDGAGIVLNSGQITGQSKGAVDLLDGGQVINDLLATITATGTGAAVYGNGAPVLVTTNGLITATSPGIAAIALKAGGTINNLSSGTIDGAGAAVVGAAYVSLSNLGLINGYGTAAAVALGQGGNVSNASTAGITAKVSSAVYVTGSASVVGRVLNGGTLRGAADGVDIRAGGYVMNAAGGLIAGVDWGVHDVTPSGTVINQGSITATNTTVGTTPIGVGFGTAAGAYLSNATLGYINGVEAVFSGGTANTVQNAGTILGGTAGVFFSAGGTITNQSSGTIQGTGIIPGNTAATAWGVKIGGAPGTVSNIGTIYGRTYAVQLGDGGTIKNQIGGFIKNQVPDSITGVVPFSGNVAINLRGSVAATILNAGTIGAIGTFPQPGTPSSDLSGAISATGVAVIGGVYLSNFSTGLIAGLYGVRSNSGPVSIANAGTIRSNGSTARPGTVQAAVYVNASGGTQAYLGNTGYIYGYQALRVANGGATVVNSGTIKGGTINNTLRSSGSTVTTFGLYLKAGGSVTNGTGGLISAGRYGIASASPNSVTTVTNSGSIAAPIGVRIWGGTVVNQMQGVIISADKTIMTAAVEVDGYGTILNAGTLTGAGTDYTVVFKRPSQYGATGTGVDYFSNASSGVVGGGNIALAINAPALVMNAGKLNGYLDVVGGDVVTNAANAYIKSIDEAAGGPVISVTNAGTILGALSVFFAGAGSFINKAGGLVQPNGASTGSYNGFGVVITNGAGTVENAGTISGLNANSFSGPAVVFLAQGFADRLIVDPGAVFLGENGVPGRVDGGNAPGGAAVSTLEFTAGTGTLSGIGSYVTNFSSIELDPGATWKLEGNAAGFAGTISGFAAGDIIDLDHFVAQNSSFSNGVLTLTNASNGMVALNLGGGFALGDFVVNGDGTGSGTDVALACFAAGTRIETPGGAAAIESLRAGDLVLAHGGDGGFAAVPVVWLGHRTVNCTAHPDPRSVWPVRIRAGALGRDRPRRDLLLSPCHALFLNGVLIPVRLLIDGAGIAQIETDRVRYYHLELAEHAVILAEGVAAESYLDIGDRANFQNGGAVARLFPDFAARLPPAAARTWETRGAAPLVLTGRTLTAARRDIARRAYRVRHTSVADTA